MSDHQFLHPILPCEFLDSPEFESSRANMDEKFKVKLTFFTTTFEIYSRTTLIAGINNSSHVLQVLVLAKVFPGVPLRERDLPCYCCHYLNSKRYSYKIVCYEQQSTHSYFSFLKREREPENLTLRVFFSDNNRQRLTSGHSTA